MTARKKKEYVKLYVPELVQLVESGDEKMCLIMAHLNIGLEPEKVVR
jgi:hypothetical protein